MPKINARKKGHAYELQIIDWCKKLGWEQAVSARSESKRTDDKGVDICYTDPFNFQCKAVENLGSIHKVLKAMPNESNYNVVLHKRNRQGTIVAMTLEDFTELISMLKQNQII